MHAIVQVEVSSSKRLEHPSYIFNDIGTDTG